jgi:hypothetical protein
MRLFTFRLLHLLDRSCGRVHTLRRRPGRRVGRTDEVRGWLLLLTVWTVVAVVLLGRESFTDKGPPSLHQPPLGPAPGALGRDQVLDICFPGRLARDRFHVVGGRVDGRMLYACYQLAADGRVPAATVVDENGQRVLDVGALYRPRPRGRPPTRAGSRRAHQPRAGGAAARGHG